MSECPLFVSLDGLEDPLRHADCSDCLGYALVDGSPRLIVPASGSTVDIGHVRLLGLSRCHGDYSFPPCYPTIQPFANPDHCASAIITNVPFSSFLTRRQGQCGILDVEWE